MSHPWSGNYRDYKTTVNAPNQLSLHSGWKEKWTIPLRKIVTRWHKVGGAVGVNATPSLAPLGRPAFFLNCQEIKGQLWDIVCVLEFKIGTKERLGERKWAVKSTWRGGLCRRIIGQDLAFSLGAGHALNHVYTKKLDFHRSQLPRAGMEFYQHLKVAFGTLPWSLCCCCF